MVPPTEDAADLGQRSRRHLLGEIHGHLTRTGNGARAALGAHFRRIDLEMRGAGLLDFIHGDAAGIGADSIGQHLLGEIQINRTPGQLAISDQLVEGAFQFAHVRPDRAGEEIDHHVGDGRVAGQSAL